MKKRKRNRRINNPALTSVKDSLKYLHEKHGSVKTDKDMLFTKWINQRANEILNSSGPRDALLFSFSGTAVSEMERLYDTIERAVRTKFPTVDVDEFFKTIKMYLGRDIRGGYSFITDWKTLMFRIGGELQLGIFPVLGLHYHVAVSLSGLIRIQKINGDIIATIPVIPDAEKRDGGIYPQHGESLENVNLEYKWDQWYELNRLIGNEKEWCKSMKYFDEILEYTLSKDLFNRKKIISQK